MLTWLSAVVSFLCQGTPFRDGVRHGEREMKTLVFAAGVALAGFAGSANAATVVQMDVNSVTAVANAPAFGPGYTGNLTLTKDGTSALAAMLKNGTGLGIGFGGPYLGANLDFAATFSFNAGAITGIGYTLKVSSALNGVLDNIYMASVVPGVGNIANDPGKPGSYIVAAQTFGGSFNASSFGGVDVSEFTGMDLPGNFLNFKIDGSAINGTSKTDNDVDIDIFVYANVIPLPTPVALAGAGLLGLAAIRRRRA